MSVCVCVSLSLYLYTSICLSVYMSLSLSVSVSVSVSLTHAFYLNLFLSQFAVFALRSSFLLRWRFLLGFP